MKLVFLKNVPNVARAGEVKEVADGYGRNFLIPRKLAVVATPAELKKLEIQRQVEAQHQIRSQLQAEDFLKALEELTLTIKARAGGKDRLYGSITSADIAKEIRRVTGYELDKRKIEVEKPIRQLGSYEVLIRLGKDLTRKLKVNVEEEKS